jgi:hypothetical protein
MRAGSLGREKVIKQIQIFSAEEGGVLFPAPSAKKPAPQDVKRSALPPEPFEVL